MNEPISITDTPGLPVKKLIWSDRRLFFTLVLPISLICGGLFRHWEFVGILSVAFVLFCFLRNLGKTIPILEITLLMAGLQWIITPIFSYSSEDVALRYIMAVDSNTYFSITVPSFLGFVSGVFAFIRPLVWEITVSAEEAQTRVRFSYFLFALSIAGVIGESFMRGGLAFISYLLDLSAVCGALIYLHHGKKFKYLPLVIIGISWGWYALRSTMFHDFLLLLLWVFMYLAYLKRWSIRTCLLLLLAGIVGAFILQEIKEPYRDLYAFQERDGRLTTIASLAWERFGNLQGDDLHSHSVTQRFNQGWIIGNIYAYIPQHSEYLAGETVWDTAKAIFMPRFLVPNKRVSGGRENFTKMTGLGISQLTSINVSILGEAYANFGPFGSIIHLFLCGALLASILRFLLWIMNKTRFKEILFMLPLIFFVTPKAESDTLDLINHIVKALLITWSMFYLWYNLNPKRRTQKDTGKE